MKRYDKGINKMNKEEILKAINKLPKIETNNLISTMNSINVDDLMSAIDRFDKVPTYQDLLNKNNKLEQTLDEIEKYIKLKFVAQGAFTSYEWNDLLSDILQIVNKAKGN